MRFSLPQTKRVKEFSRGMKMKLAISVALSHDSRLLILDEATSGLDPMVREEMLDIFMDFIQDENKSILLSSHIISDLEKICDYITYIHNGEVLFSEDKNDLLDRFVILKCSDQELANVDPQAIVGVRRNRFGTEALALRDKVGGLYLQDPATIENIMLYYGRGDTK